MGAFSNFYLNSQSSEHYYWSPWRSEKAKKWILMVLRSVTWAFQYCISDCSLHDCVIKKEMMDGRGYYGFIILIVGRNNCKMFWFSFLCSRGGCNRILLHPGTLLAPNSYYAYCFGGKYSEAAIALFGLLHSFCWVHCFSRTVK